MTLAIKTLIWFCFCFFQVYGGWWSKYFHDFYVPYKIPQPVFIVCYLPCTLSHMTLHLYMERRGGGWGGGWQGSSRENKNEKENVCVCLCVHACKTCIWNMLVLTLMIQKYSDLYLWPQKNECNPRRSWTLLYLSKCCLLRTWTFKILL